MVEELGGRLQVHLEGCVQGRKVKQRGVMCQKTMTMMSVMITKNAVGEERTFDQ